MLTWDKKWDEIVDTSNPPFFKWWVGGRLNACVNCVDRHLESRGDKNAIIWVPELEDDETEEITYRDLHRRVNEFAALLKDFCGVKPQDRVTFHMPMVPDLPVAMLACARLGVIHSQVFGGFSGHACGQRMADAKSTILVTMDAYYRGGELIDHKIKADDAVEAAREEGIEVEKILVFRRIPGEYHSESEMVEGRDFFVDELLDGLRGPGGRARVDGGRGHAVPDVHERHHRSPEGRAALDRRLSELRRPGRRSTTRTSIPTTRTGASPTSAGSPVTRTSSTGRSRSGRRRVMYEGIPTYPDAGQAVADRREAGRGHLPHRADDDPDAAQGRPRRARQVRLRLQDDDDGRRADRARRVALVLEGRRQGRGGDHRHLVDDRDRRLPRQHAAVPAADEAGQLRAGLPRDPARDLRRERRGDPEGLGQGGLRLRAQPVARAGC